MRYLVMSGGGSKWAYEVGAIQHLCGDLEIEYDGYCGVSAGALNAGFMAQYAAGEERLAAELLYRLLRTVDGSRIYRRWFPFGKLHALWKPSMLNSAPLQQLIRTVLDEALVRESGKRLRVGAVSLTTGTYRLFKEDYADLAGAIIASSAFPAMFCPVELDGELWTDGGVREVTPLKAAIDLGATEVDVIVTSPDYSAPGFPRSPNTLDVGKRVLDLMSDEIISDDLKVALLHNRLAARGLSTKREVKIRIVRPDAFLTDDSLDFDPAVLEGMRKAGYEDAKRICPTA
jgi:NTE family protein